MLNRCEGALYRGRFDAVRGVSDLFRWTVEPFEGYPEEAGSISLCECKCGVVRCVIGLKQYMANRHVPLAGH